MAQGEFFRPYHLPVLSAEQNEEINVTDESLAKNRLVPKQEIKLATKKVCLVGHSVCCA